MTFGSLNHDGTLALFAFARPDATLPTLSLPLAASGLLLGDGAAAALDELRVGRPSTTNASAERDRARRSDDDDVGDDVARVKNAVAMREMPMPMRDGDGDERTG